MVQGVLATGLKIYRTGAFHVTVTGSHRLISGSVRAAVYRMLWEAGLNLQREAVALMMQKGSCTGLILMRWYLNAQTAAVL